MSESSVRIGELARRAGVTVRMLRYYEQQGLLSPQRTRSGYRAYSDQDVERVTRIRCMIGLGIATRVVRRITLLLHGPAHAPIDGQHASVILHELESELRILDERLAELQKNRELLHGFLQEVRRRATLATAQT